MKRSAKAQAALDAVIARFQSGDLSPVVEIARIRRDPNDDMPSSRWSFGNQVMAYIQTGTLDCRGFRQWKQAGRHVKKGSRAAYILGPRKIRIKDKDNDGEEKTIIAGFVSIPVFSVDQTDGEPLPVFNYTPAELPPLADVAASMDISVSWEPTRPGILGSASPDGTTVKLGTQDPSVFFHELAHAVHAKIEGDLQGGQHADQETAAEFTACALMWLYGLGDYTGNAWRYIQHYNKKDPIAAIAKAMATVEQILDVLQA